MKIELTKRWEFQVLAACMVLLAAAAGWLLLTRPGYRIEGDFLRREDQRNLKDGWLVAQLRSSVAQQRARACLAMGRIGDVQARDLLLNALNDPIPRVRAAAAFALGEIEDRETLAELGLEPHPEAAKALLGALRDEERGVAANAVEALGKMRWEASFPQITQTPAPLVVTMTALMRLNIPEAIPWIAARRRSDDQDTRWAAALALHHLGAEVDDKITRSFVNLTNDINAWVREAAVRGLSRAQPSPDVIQALIEMAGDNDPKVRVAALDSLSRLRAKDTLPLIVSGLQDPNPNVRLAAVDAIAHFGDRAGVPILQSLRFRSSALSYRAETALAKLATEEEFFAELQDFPPAYRNPAGARQFVKALGRYRSARSIEWLQQVWTSEEPYARAARAETLQALVKQDVDAEAYLQTALDNPRPEVNVGALELQDTPKIEACKVVYDKALTQPDLQIRLAALDAGARAAADERQKRLFMAALEDPIRPVRARAIQHLRLLYDEDHGDRLGPADTRYNEEDYQRIARTVNRHITMLTSAGALEIELDFDNAPLTAEHFFALAEQGYFDGQAFSQVSAGSFVAARVSKPGPESGLGSPIRTEINTQPFLRGSLGVLEGAKDVGGNRFFICLSPLPLWDGRYTNFGRLVSGDEVLDRITTDARILNMVVPE